MFKAFYFLLDLDYCGLTVIVRDRIVFVQYVICKVWIFHFFFLLVRFRPGRRQIGVRVYARKGGLTNEHARSADVIAKKDNRTAYYGPPPEGRAVYTITILAGGRGISARCYCCRASFAYYRRGGHGPRGGGGR